MKNLKFCKQRKGVYGWSREYRDNWFWTSEMLFAAGLGMLLGLALAASI